MAAENEKFVSFRIDPEDYKRFKQLCVGEGKTVKAYLTELVTKELKRKEKRQNG